LLFVVELGALHAGHATGQRRNEVCSSWAGLALLSVPDGGFGSTGLALLGGFVQDGSTVGAFAGAVHKGVGASDTAVLDSGVPDCTDQADSAVTGCIVPFGLASNAGLITVQVGGVFGAAALGGSFVPGETIRTTNAGLVLAVPSVGGRAWDTLSLGIGLEFALTGASIDSSIPGLVGGASKAGVIVREPLSRAGHAGIVGSFNLQERLIFGAAALRSGLIEEESCGTGHTLVVLEVPSVGGLTFLAFSCRVSLKLP
jgi:hypothetical protein